LTTEADPPGENVSIHDIWSVVPSNGKYITTETHAVGEVLDVRCKHNVGLACMMASLSLGWTEASVADGVILGKGGRYVTEKEQMAFIEWHEGQERLFVSTRAAEAPESTLWLVPVPAQPAQVTAVPVKHAPTIGTDKPLVKPVREYLQCAWIGTFSFDTGLVALSPLAIVLSGEETHTTFGNTFGGVSVHHHVEKLGMVVEVITAQSTDALDQYLADKQIQVRADQITALEGYLGQEYSLVCSWVATPSKMEARAVRIDFSTSHLFFPLRPTSVYEDEIETGIYVRGVVQPRKGTSIPGLQCRYVLGSAPGANAKHVFGPKPTPRAAHEVLTHITLRGSPRNWTQDLYLEEGSMAVRAAGAIYGFGPGLFVTIHIFVGAILGGLLLTAIVPAQARRRYDVAVAAGLGAMVVLSISATCLFGYFWLRSRDQQAREKSIPELAKGSPFFAALAAVLLASIGLWFFGPRGSVFDPFIWGEVISVALLLSIVFVAPAIASIGVMRSEWTRVGQPVVNFALLHMALTLVPYSFLYALLTPYA